jgi:hypothetical protein
MLTPIDIHYIVGLLTQICEEEKISLTLGDTIFDIAAQEDRDIDITIKYEDDLGKIKVIKGIEVKDHTRPLNVEHVEQLCLKLKDTAAINDKSIVSASDYTKGAINKAKYYGVELYELVECEELSLGQNSSFINNENFAFNERNYSWIESELFITTPIPIDAKLIIDEIQVKNPDGSEKEGVKNLGELKKVLLDGSLNKCIPQLVVQNFQPNEVKLLRVNAELEDSPCLFLNGRLIPIKNVMIIGKVKFLSTIKKSNFKILRRVADKIPLVGCAVAEMENRTLMGISINNKKKDITFFHVGINDRNRRKIYKQDLPSI